MAAGNTSDVIRLLEVGLACVFTPDQSQPKERIQAVIRGWSEGKYVIVEVSSGGARQPLMRKGGKSLLRFLNDGKACAAATSIVEWKAGPYTKLEWPDSIDYMTVRKQARVDLDLPCEICLADNTTSTVRLRDVSSGGCGFLTDGTFNEDDEVKLTFTLPDGARIENASFSVRNVRAVSQGVAIVGCVLTDPMSPVRHDLEFFVASTVVHERRDASTNTSILIIDGTPEAHDYAQTLKAKKYDASVAVDLVDGFFKLRLALPAVVLVASTQQQSSGADICRFIRGARGLDEIPVYLYGDSAQSDAQASGATGAIASLEGEDWFTTIAKHLPSIAAQEESPAPKQEAKPAAAEAAAPAEEAAPPPTEE